jgi:protease-4
MNNDIQDNSNMDSQTLLQQIVVEYFKDQKRRRRWRMVKTALFFLVAGFIAYQFWGIDAKELGNITEPHAGLIELTGEISDAKSANSDDFNKGMENAYKNKGLKAIILRINSPGGSPVQAEYMYNSIRYYRSRYPEVKIYAVCADYCASAAYYIAAAADEIYASPASVVGSIGVLYNGFGFVDAMNKLGITRRLQTSGANKGFFDSFSPVTEFQKQKLQVILDLIHQQFIARVKEGRGNRLHIDDELFSGLFWTGEQALSKGLVDGYASSNQLARDLIKVDTIVDYSYKQNILDRMTKNLGTALADELPVSLGFKPDLR